MRTESRESSDTGLQLAGKQVASCQLPANFKLQVYLNNFALHLAKSFWQATSAATTTTMTTPTTTTTKPNPNPNPNANATFFEQFRFFLLLAFEKLPSQLSDLRLQGTKP